LTSAPVFEWLSHPIGPNVYKPLLYRLARLIGRWREHVSAMRSGPTVCGA
jgi:hypothetical protein